MLYRVDWGGVVLGQKVETQNGQRTRSVAWRLEFRSCLAWCTSEADKSKWNEKEVLHMQHNTRCELEAGAQ